jgi:hypothetical protein
MTPADPGWYNDDLLGLFIGTFAGRVDLYVENGAEVKREPLTPEVLRHAIAHRYAISAYLGQADGRTHVGAIDFDTANGLEQARQVQHLLDAHDIPSLVVGSRRGAHLWVSLFDYSDTTSMHRCLKAAVALSAGQPAADDPKVEVFPKRGESLAVGALRLPGMPHQRDQQVYPVYVGAESHPAPTFDQLVDLQQLAMAAAISRLAGRLAPPREYPKALGDFYGYSHAASRLGDAPKASAVLAEGWGLQVRPGGNTFCPFHDDKRRSLTVFKDDQRVFCGAPACALNNAGHGVGSIQLRGMIR